MPEQRSAEPARAPRVGAWVALDAPIATEQIARAGFDYVCVDGQHGVIGYDAQVRALLAVAAGGAEPWARVSTNSAAEIGRVLDAGARGVIVPLIDTAAEARAAAEAARYPTSGGRRSYGPMRLGPHFGATPEETDASVTVLAMIETASGLAELDSILDVEGVDGVYVGPYDLSLALGARVPFEDAIVPRLDAELDRIAAACRERGKIAGVHCADGEQAARRIEQGFTMVTAATDVSSLRADMQRQLAAATGSRLGAARAY
ncbi:HpcH/HpaI aldolase/citrate lyase family protein [Agrococcus sp. HG114]|uniref:HpcH/HpaI aldolase family protein n=1 Tax=Agrococcus sp. HG114 TaxID=2969757 RepID=UPI00215ABE9A|nr:aldolase/citrate lyase family protein [Agrococcus sp. HG114]MCR8669591.1 aldolase/citrate lyase family protein [Agrococcus sp. HG114]